MKNNKKHILIIHPSFCIRAKKQAEALIANSNYSLSIITDVDNKKPQLSDYIKSNANIYSFKFHDNYYVFFDSLITGILFTIRIILSTFSYIDFL